MPGEMGGSIKELWVYPVKACKGVSVQSAKLTSTGLELDRTWCIVDLDGVNISKMEAVSQRKVPMLATVSVAFSADRSALMLDAPGMPQLEVPTAAEAYASAETVTVECSGKSTTTGGGWSLGFEEGKLHSAGSAWFTEYLNREVEAASPSTKVLSGHRQPSRYALVRSMQPLMMSSYPPIFPVIEKAATDESYAKRFAGNAKRFADFAPLLIVNQDSAKFVGDRTPTGQNYPIAPFRGNVVLGETAGSWSEETWRQIEVSGAKGSITLQKIKECPRCTVPCRDQVTGGWVFPEDSLRLWKILRKAFPGKDKDPEWGTWAGPFFGVYFGNASQEGTLSVGDAIRVKESCHWDDHLRWRPCTVWAAGAGALAVATVAIAGAVWARNRTRR